ncbi:MAG: hypothetical protein JW784_01430 [Candidatus Cloacimonetes bacterium]|nr:hypothetical protein [Candidatus Cloacimonadota bacterium]
MKRILIGICFLLVTLSLNGQDLEYTLEKTARLFIGTPFHILVNITSHPGDSIFVPPLDSLDIFLLQGVQEQEEIIKGVQHTRLNFTFQAFEIGEHTFPPLEFLVKSAAGSKVLQTGAFQLNITSVLPDSAQSIRDIAGPLPIKPGFWDIAVLVVILSGLVFILSYIIRRIRSRAGKMPEVKSAGEVRPAYAIVLSLLLSLREQKLLEKGDLLNLYFQLSLLCRLFLELQYGLKAVEMTTSEIRENLVLPDHKQKSQIMDFLKTADKVKFAKHHPVNESAGEALDWLESYLKSFAVEQLPEKAGEENV